MHAFLPRRLHVLAEAEHALADVTFLRVELVQPEFRLRRVDIADGVQQMFAVRRAQQIRNVEANDVHEALERLETLTLGAVRGNRFGEDRELVGEIGRELFDTFFARVRTFFGVGEPFAHLLLLLLARLFRASSFGVLDHFADRVLERFRQFEVADDLRELLAAEHQTEEFFGIEIVQRDSGRTVGDEPFVLSVSKPASERVRRREAGVPVVELALFGIAENGYEETKRSAVESILLLTVRLRDEFESFGVVSSSDLVETLRSIGMVLE